MEKHSKLQYLDFTSNPLQFCGEHINIFAACPKDFKRLSLPVRNELLAIAERLITIGEEFDL